ncbi:unnamed protein product [Vitrella brassicaformis CCMP3155]|uniref:Bromo domain-containing protein n=3 Tax=Vitrella brassicaformis TaxID=1169539 RepID=A0A0G4FAC8_VITBC|nr:unnamed protein product [Vitrella brassicaformis CCMP3155]|eukprot:CEM09854.1 unnamed protein product [Vitrella brassicaformis CCMP3155]
MHPPREPSVRYPGPQHGHPHPRRGNWRQPRHPLGYPRNPNPSQYGFAPQPQRAASGVRPGPPLLHQHQQQQHQQPHVPGRQQVDPLEHENRVSIMRMALDSLKQEKTFKAFCKPVFAMREKFTRTMDLQTLEENVNNGFYPTLESFASDLRLIWVNCENYAKEDSKIYGLARDLCMRAAEILRPYLPHFPFQNTSLPGDANPPPPPPPPGEPPGGPPSMPNPYHQPQPSRPFPQRSQQMAQQMGRPFPPPPPMRPSQYGEFGGDFGGGGYYPPPQQGGRGGPTLGPKEPMRPRRPPVPPQDMMRPPPMHTPDGPEPMHTMSPRGGISFYPPRPPPPPPPDFDDASHDGDHPGLSFDMSPPPPTEGPHVRSPMRSPPMRRGKRPPDSSPVDRRGKGSQGPGVPAGNKRAKRQTRAPSAPVHSGQMPPLGAMAAEPGARKLEVIDSSNGDKTPRVAKPPAAVKEKKEHFFDAPRVTAFAMKSSPQPSRRQPLIRRLEEEKARIASLGSQLDAAVDGMALSDRAAEAIQEGVWRWTEFCRQEMWRVLVGEPTQTQEGDGPNKEHLYCSVHMVGAMGTGVIAGEDATLELLTIVLSPPGEKAQPKSVVLPFIHQWLDRALADDLLQGWTKTAADPSTTSSSSDKTVALTFVSSADPPVTVRCVMGFSPYEWSNSAVAYTRLLRSYAFASDSVTKAALLMHRWARMVGLPCRYVPFLEAPSHHILPLERPGGSGGEDKAVPSSSQPSDALPPSDAPMGEDELFDQPVFFMPVPAASEVKSGVKTEEQEAGAVIEEKPQEQAVASTPPLPPSPPSVPSVPLAHDFWTWVVVFVAQLPQYKSSRHHAALPNLQRCISQQAPDRLLTMDLEGLPTIFLLEKGRMGWRSSPAVAFPLFDPPAMSAMREAYENNLGGLEQEQEGDEQQQDLDGPAGAKEGEREGEGGGVGVKAMDEVARLSHEREERLDKKVFGGSRNIYWEYSAVELLDDVWDFIADMEWADTGLSIREGEQIRKKRPSFSSDHAPLIEDPITRLNLCAPTRPSQFSTIPTTISTQQPDKDGNDDPAIKEAWAAFYAILKNKAIETRDGLRQKIGGDGLGSANGADGKTGAFDLLLGQ